MAWRRNRSSVVWRPTDRRITIVEITEGAAAVEEQIGSFRRAIDELLAALSESERRTLARILTGLEARIHGD